MRPKYIAGPISSRSNVKFIPHMGNKVPFGIVRTASTYLKKKNIALGIMLQREISNFFG